MPLSGRLRTTLPLTWTRCRRIGTYLALTLLAVCIATVLTQDLHIFPLLATGRESAPPADIEALSVRSADGSAVLVWRLRAQAPKPHAALLLHGNATTVAGILHLQRWLAGKGITTYSMEYRGYNGLGSGWPSELGLYEDAQATFETMLREEGIEAPDALVLGTSIGSGIASHIAARYQPGVLVLISPYTSLPDVARERSFFGFFTPFLWYRFPSRENVERLSRTCVVAAHGRKDSVIPFHHSEVLRDAYTGTKTFTLLESPDAGHNSIFSAVEGQLAEAIEGCFVRR